MTKFKVGDKVRILDVDSIDYGSKFWQNGDVTKVTRIKAERGVYLATPCSSDEGLYVTKAELDYIEKVSDTPTKNQRITTLEQNVVSLESEVAELKAKVEALEKAQKPSYQIGVDFARTGADISKGASQLAKLIEGESDKRRKKMSLTPNELRKAIIDEAKAFVDAQFIEGNFNVGKVVDKHHGHNTVEFVVNPKKRTVVAILRFAYAGNRVVDKAIAKCAPDDVFNADIGKAIALGRALGLDVSRFEQADKPTEVVVGMVVKNIGRAGGTSVCTKVDTSPYGQLRIWRSSGWIEPENAVITDDTEAVY